MKPGEWWDFLKAFLAIWKRIVPDPPPIITKSMRGFRIQKEVSLWQRVWRIGGVLSVAVIWIPGNGDERLPIFITWGILLISCTVLLVNKEHFPGRYVAAWRWGLCGDICILVPYLAPGLAWAAFDNIASQMGIDNPWEDPGLFHNGIACMAIALLNMAICGWAWQRSTA